MAHDVDVVVVGGGPVGVTALAFLGNAGMSAIGFEQSGEVWPTARAVHFDGETFRTMQSLQIAEDMGKVTIPMETFHIENEAREVLLKLPTGRFGNQAWHDSNTFHQPDVESLLRQRLSHMTGVELRTGMTVTQVSNTADGVEVVAKDSNGNEQAVRARWAIAADGGRSDVRHMLNIETEKFGEDADWLVVDGILKDSPGYETDMIFLGHHTRPALWVRLPGDRVRMEFMVMPGDDPEEIVTAEAVERLSDGVLPAAKFDSDRQALYTFRGRIAKKWKDGNIFLAGDAAHLTPPLFGQGLCAGIRDVVNLVWKLDFVRRGLAPESLLDTYESERKAHAQAWVEQATNSAKFVQTTDPEVAVQRDAFIRANPAAAAPIIPPLGPGLHQGSTDERAGRISVQPILADGVRLDDMVGVHFLVATQHDLYEQLSPEVIDALGKDAETVVLTDPAKVSEILSSVESQGVIVRPDRYIMAAVESPADLDAAIRTIPSVATILAAKS